MSAIPSIKPLSDKCPAGPANDRLADGRTTAEPGRREQGWAGRKPAGPAGPAAAPKGKPRPDGEKLPAVGRRAPGADLRGKLKWASIEKKISTHKLRHTYRTHLLDAGAERVDIEAPLGHERVATTRIDTDVGQERMEQVVGRL